MIRHIINIILYLLPPTRLFFFRRILLRLAKIKVMQNVCFSGRGWIYGRGDLIIQTNTWLSPGVIFYTHKNAPITIGKNCDIGPDVKFVIGSHKVDSGERRAGQGTANSINIGEGCWIGAGAIILDGITIGPGCIIGAGAVVTENIGDNVLAAGVPAKIKKRLL